jgi:hypothetical protein
MLQRRDRIPVYAAKMRWKSRTRLRGFRHRSLEHQARRTGALNLRGPGSIEGNYTAIGTGGALAGGAGTVRLRITNGVILQLSGPKVGVELLAAVAGVTIRLK